MTTFENIFPRRRVSGISTSLFTTVADLARWDENFYTHQVGGEAFDAGYRADLLRFPDRHFSVIVLANLGNMNPSALCRRVAHLLFPAWTGEVTMAKQLDTTAARVPAPGRNWRPTPASTIAKSWRLKW